jgi:competence protein ComEA
VNRAEIAARASVLTLIVAVVVGCYSLIPHFRAESFVPVVLDAPEGADSREVVVNISGEVAHPGLYALDASSSLSDMLRVALGDNQAIPNAVSLVIGDGSQGDSQQRVDLNHADAWLLDALPGIGPDRAQAIVDFRARNGPFSSVEELLLVPGFGNATVDAVKELVTVTP